MKFQQVDLSGDAVPYIRKSLHSGLTLSRHVVNLFDLSIGTITTVLPEDVSIEEAKNFDCGGKFGRLESETTEFADEHGGGTWISARQRNTDHEFARFVNKLLQDDEARTIVFEDATRKSTDLSLSRIDTRMFFVGAEVYHLVNEASLEKVEYTIRRVRSWMLNGFCTRLSSNVVPLIPDRSQLPTNFIQQISRAVEYIFVNAYDGESTLVCAVGDNHERD